MNWGLKIIVAYLSFIVLLVVLAYYSFSAKVDLVSEDYYRQEIAYQDRIEEIENERNLDHTVAIKTDLRQGFITLAFPKGMSQSQGDIYLYRPSNADWDRHFKISLDPQRCQQLELQGLPAGRWSLQLHWESNGQPFYKQQSIYLP